MPHPNAMPNKTTETVTFVDDNGQELQVIRTISKSDLATLKRRGYKRKRDTPPPVKETSKPETEEVEDEDTETEEEEQDTEEEAEAESEEEPTPTRPPARRQRSK